MITQWPPLALKASLLTDEWHSALTLCTKPSSWNLVMSYVRRLQALLQKPGLSSLHSSLSTTLPTAVSSWPEGAVSVLLVSVALEESLVTTPPPTKLGL